MKVSWEVPSRQREGSVQSLSAGTVLAISKQGWYGRLEKVTLTNLVRDETRVWKKSEGLEDFGLNLCVMRIFGLEYF